MGSLSTACSVRATSSRLVKGRRARSLAAAAAMAWPAAAAAPSAAGGVRRLRRLLLPLPRGRVSPTPVPPRFVLQEKCCQDSVRTHCSNTQVVSRSEVGRSVGPLYLFSLSFNRAISRSAKFGARRGRPTSLGRHAPQLEAWKGAQKMAQALVELLRKTRSHSRARSSSPATPMLRPASNPDLALTSGFAA